MRRTSGRSETSSSARRSPSRSPTCRPSSASTRSSRSAWPGPAFLWAFPIVLAGQLFVCGVFGNLVSKWPLQGSVYAWSRELIGPRYGWFTGWAYMWGLTLTLAVLPITAAPYILAAAGVAAPSQITVELVAIGVLLFGSAANLFGRWLLKGLIYIALVAPILASARIATPLIL